jgi:hypothetical protein
MPLSNGYHSSSSFFLGYSDLKHRGRTSKSTINVVSIEDFEE